MIIFIYIPNSFTAFHNVSAFYNNNNKLILSEYSKISQRIFSQVCIKLKLRCINTVEIFQKYNTINKYPSHFPKSNSLTEAGHDLIARKVFDELCQNETNKLIFDQECNSNF